MVKISTKLATAAAAAAAKSKKRAVLKGKKRVHAAPSPGFHAATLRRICQRAGVESVSPTCYPHMNDAAFKLLTRILHDAVNNVDARNARIISEADARRALVNQGITYYGTPRCRVVKYAK